MPRIQRRRSRLKQGGLTRGGTRWQMLMYGSFLLPEDGLDFRDAGEERRAWIEHRDELLRSCEPGRRPAAYFRFDLSLDHSVDKWYQQIKSLLDHDLIGTEEMLRCENTYRELDPNQSVDFCSAFERPADIRQQQLGGFVLCGIADKFNVAARWHRWRGRPGLADRYELRAETTRNVGECAI